jgi:hypothetical protein
LIIDDQNFYHMQALRSAWLLATPAAAALLFRSIMNPSSKARAH